MAQHRSTTQGMADDASEMAHSAYETGRRVMERAEGKIDELSRFGAERPLLAMGIAFALGYFTGKILKW